VGKPEGRGLVGKPRYIWEDNIKLDLNVWVGRAWTRLIWLGKIEKVLDYCKLKSFNSRKL
jgi:hypothetical protein